MDKDKNYIPPRNGKDPGGSGYGRRVSGVGEDMDYDMERAREALNRKRSSEKKKRETRRRQEKARRRKMCVRSVLAVAAVLLIAFIVLFMTPLLNVKNVTFAGNSIVKSEELEPRLENAKGKNLITISDEDVKAMFSDLSYVEDATISKFLIPPSIRVNITECKPAAVVELSGRSIIIDPQLKILSDNNEFDDEVLPRVEGLSISKYRVGDELTLADDDKDKLEILRTCLDMMSRLGMLEKIDYIDLVNTKNIRFGYDDRIDALCGSELELERKIRMFNATVTGTALSDNAHGTIDLTTLGKAVYIP